jgi:hypothetical protein
MEHWNADPEAGKARLAVDAVPQFKVGRSVGPGCTGRDSSAGWACRCKFAAVRWPPPSCCVLVLF